MTVDQQPFNRAQAEANLGLEVLISDLSSTTHTNTYKHTLVMISKGLYIIIYIGLGKIVLPYTLPGIPLITSPKLAQIFSVYYTFHTIPIFMVRESMLVNRQTAILTGKTAVKQHFTTINSLSCHTR